MKSDKDPNTDVDLSKFFEKDVVKEIRPATIQPIDMKMREDKKQGSLIWVVVVNFIIGAAIFSYYIVKSNAEAAVKPVSVKNISAPVNYNSGSGEAYTPPLP